MMHAHDTPTAQKATGSESSLNYPSSRRVGKLWREKATAMLSFGTYCMSNSWTTNTGQYTVSCDDIVSHLTKPYEPEPHHINTD